MRFFTFVFILATLQGFCLDLQRSLVEIYVFQKEYDYTSPWDAPKVLATGGSGFVIAPNLIMTNAHVASDVLFMEVRLNGFSKRYSANVSLIGHDCDLALLTVDDEEFQQLALPVEFGNEVIEGDLVTVMGFPLLQEGVSLTQGIVSRTQVEQYVHSGIPLYCSQIDAAINPGNSGGPVVHEGKVVGVAFQGYMCLQNLGYMIPIPVIEHFLRDAEDGNYKGFPFIGMSMQTLENAHMRKYLGMEENQSGVMVTDVYEGFYDLQEKDVILAIDGVSVENDGFVLIGDKRRLLGTHLVTSKYRDEVVELKILRNKKVKTINFPLELTFTDLFSVGDKPQYFIYGGLVFQPMTARYLYDQDAYSLNTDEFFSCGRPMILLSRVLPDQVNLGYHHFTDLIITAVNGEEISTLDELAEAFSDDDVIFHKIEVEDGSEIILHRKSCEEGNDFLLQRYGIHQDRYLGGE